ncbi:enhancer of rudimentary, partial [Baffinella frigidus]
SRHTIVLLQETGNMSSRTFSDFESISEAMNGICQLYETRLKGLNPGMRNITYDITDLYSFIENLGDLSCLVFN